MAKRDAGTAGWVRLRHREVLRLDPEPLLRLRAGLGPQDSAAEVGQLRERLFELRRRIAETLAEGRWPEVADAAAGAADLGCRLGVPELHRAGLNLTDCARGSDGTALAATAGRVLRLADRAVTAVGALRRQSD